MKLELKPLELSDIPIIRPFFALQKGRTCDYTIGGTFMWREYFNTEYCIEDETLFIKATPSGRCKSYCFPMGGDTPKALDRAAQDSLTCGCPLTFTQITKGQLEALQNHFGEGIDYTELRDWFDYLYNAQDLATYPGRKYAKQRNHVNKFNRLYPDWVFQKITPDNMEDLREFYDEYVVDHKKNGSLASEEQKKSHEVIDHFDEYGMKGGMLRVGGSEGRVVGIAMGEVINDTLFEHIEKADIEYDGVYQVVAQEFAKMFTTPEIAYINREEDVGDPGLRKSKLAYNPTMLLEKYVATVPVDIINKKLS